MSEPFDFLPDSWSDNEKQLWEPFANAFNDSHAQSLFDAAYFSDDYTPDERKAVREALDSYLSDTYGYDFDEMFDWETWREGYEE